MNLLRFMLRLPVVISLAILAGAAGWGLAEAGSASAAAGLAGLTALASLAWLGRLQQRAAARTQELTTVLAASREVASTLALQPLLAVLLDRLKEVVDYQVASLSGLEGEQALVVLAERGGLATVGDRADLREHPNTRAMLNEGVPYHVPDLSADTPLARRLRANIAQQPAPERYRGLATWLSVPLIARDRVVGVLVLMHTRRGYYSAHRAELALAFAAQSAVAIENARLYEQARGAAALEERHRLARELHDSVTQMLYSLNLFAEAGRQKLLRGDAERAAHHLAQIGETAQQAHKEMRLLLFELRPPALSEGGLLGALRQRLEAVELRAGVAAQLRAPALPALPETVEAALYRIALEALNNALKHAGAAAVTVTVQAAAGRVTLTVADDGRGFDPAAASRGGLGLTGMRERAERLGGALTLAAAAGQGTVVTAILPLPAEV